MTQEENKKNVLLSRLAPIADAIKTSIADDITTEVVLTSAMEGAKNLGREIGEYLESRKPKFKVGDYVVEDNGNIISRLDEPIPFSNLWGSYYKRNANFFSNIGSSIDRENIERLATPEEIIEYELALDFDKHGRNPFEVEAGDVVEKSDGDRVFVSYKNSLSKEDFISGKFVLVGTKEEFNEWMVNKWAYGVELLGLYGFKVM